MIYPTRDTYQTVPAEMRHPNTHRWVCFQCIPQPNGNISKIPFTPSGKRAASNDSRTWSGFDECLKALDFSIGNALGFALGSDFHLAVVDLDHCILPDGSLTPTARKYIDTLEQDAYIERSISGTGLHIFIWYTGRLLPPHPEPGVEIYTESRFIVMTGVPL